MKAWSFTLIALASLAAASSLQAASGDTASSDKTKPEQSIWQQAQSGTYWCDAAGTSFQSSCIPQNECRNRGGKPGAPCNPERRIVQ